MSDLVFAEAQRIHLLWGVLVLMIALAALERRGLLALDRFVAPAIQDRLVRRPSPLLRWMRLVLLTLSAIALVVALMRPQWGVEFVRSPQVGAEIMIALDVSRSMLSEDVVPNRLERAKAEIRDLLTYLQGDQVGLIAFAGRASVVCPMTPDFGFLRLVLDSVGPHSVSRGGTRLEEPIRKAIQGFGAAGDLSRVLLLITDGEDHDSFPVDAAKEAAEKGIQILAIGFGDEAGSPIMITDPQTGARTTLRDSDGRVVQSRLDGDLLRELALVTRGAYIPAGTGVLDLEGIFEAHIAPLMRATGEERGRTVRQEGFQWAVLAGLVCLLAGVLTYLPRGAVASATFATLLALGGSPELATAQTSTAGQDASQAPFVSDGDADTSASEASANPEGRAALEIPEEPRDAYNQALSRLAGGELDEAERLLQSARSRARGDGEARLAASFNLAWVEIRRAEAVMNEKPEEALDALHRAADWFREAIAIDDAHEPSRRNLEIVLHRALVLADEINKQDPKDVAQRLDDLIARQRDVAGAARQLSELSALPDVETESERLKALFKAAAVQARGVLSEARTLSEEVVAEVDAFDELAEETLTPEDQLRRAQLTGVIHYLHQARERLGQSRGQLRRRQGARAHRRAATALDLLKRARDQLREPVAILDQLLRDGTQIAGETRALLAAELALAPALGSDQPTAPPWLDADYLEGRQGALAARARELHMRLSAGLAQSEEGPPPEDPQQQKLLEQLRLAAPHLDRGAEEAERSRTLLAETDLGEAASAQASSLQALAEAREQFLDLKGLIEVAYGDQRRVDELLTVPAEDEAAAEVRIREFGSALEEIQTRNLERTRRMSGMIAEQVTALEAQREASAAAAPQPGQPQPTSPEQIEAELERLELADGVAALSEGAMQSAAEQLARLSEEDAALEDARDHVGTALRGLENLRRLFFTMVEHLRDAARRQVELGDAVEEGFGLAAGDPAALGAELGPLTARQDELAALTDQLAQALHEQSLQDPASFTQGGSGDPAADQAAAQAATDRLIKASEHVLEAADRMKDAGESMVTESPERDAIRPAQDDAVRALAQAIALLEPPQQDQQQSGDQGQQGPQQQQQQDGQGEQESQPQGAAQQAEQEEQEEQKADGRDPSQMLQSVRDKEAERHRRREGRRQQRYQTVEKDW